MRINRLLCHVPSRRLPAADILAAAGESRAQARIFGKLFGFESAAAYASPAEVETAWLELFGQIGAAAAPDAVIEVRGLPLPASLPEHPALAGARRFRIDQFNCAGLFWGLDLAERLLRQGRARRVLLLAGEDSSALPPAHRYWAGCTLIGDACAALLLDAEPGGARLERPRLARRNQHHQGLYGAPEETQAFYQAHDDMVDALLAQIGFDAERDALLPHNINQLSWVQYSRRRGLALERIRRDLLPAVGHCYAADPLLLLRRWLDEGEGEAAALLSIGLGAYSGACMARRA